MQNKEIIFLFMKWLSKRDKTFSVGKNCNFKYISEIIEEFESKENEKEQ